MRVPVSWLREYVAFDLPIDELARRLVHTSCEVLRIVPHGVPDADGNLARFRVGRVLASAKHPRADRLWVCDVDVGDGEPRAIVCGAPNVHEGATVAVALPGAELPTGLRLERREVRGAVSDGMILAEDELALGPDHSEILLLDPAHEPGTPLADVLPLVDTVLEIDTGHNRPDLLSIYGVAREVSALLDAELAPVPGQEPSRDADEPVDVRVEDPVGCPRYVGRLFRDVRIGHSPQWLKARLLAAGLRPLSNVVDVTNYVMLALGSPLHAFDADRLAGGRIVVRRARPDERIRTLDGVDRALTSDDLVIADAERPVAIAGIMGGEDSEISAESRVVLLEAANFDQLTVLRGGERLRMRSEAQSRWERGVAPQLAEQAATFATQLLVELAGARWVGTTDVGAEPPAPPTIAFRPDLVEKVIGLPVAEDEQRQRLTRLGFAVDVEWTVRVPAWRMRDVRREIDVVEEVARFRLADVPPTAPVRRELFGWLTREQRLRRLVADVLVGAGFFEAYTYSLQADDPHPEALVLPEPLSEIQRVLRTTLLHGLVGAIQWNLNAGNRGVSLFEIAHVYLPTGERTPRERWHVGGIVEGDFFRAKGVVETLLEALAVEPSFAAERHPLLPLGLAARTPAGWVGELEPELLDGDWAYFELDLDELSSLVPPPAVYDDVLTYPPVREDLAFVVDEEVPAGELAAAAREAGGDALREIRIFDVYAGPQVGEGRKSVAFSVAYGSRERTLTDADALRIRASVVEALGRRFGAELRVGDTTGGDGERPA